MWNEWLEWWRTQDFRPHLYSVLLNGEELESFRSEKEAEDFIQYDIENSEEQSKRESYTIKVQENYYA